MFRVNESHEAALVLRNQLAELVPGRIITNRHPGSDHFHIEMDQDVAAALLDLLTTTPRKDTTHERSQFKPLSRTRPAT